MQAPGSKEIAEIKLDFTKLGVIAPCRFQGRKKGMIRFLAGCHKKATNSAYVCPVLSGVSSECSVLFTRATSTALRYFVLSLASKGLL